MKLLKQLRTLAYAALFLNAVILPPGLLGQATPTPAAITATPTAALPAATPYAPVAAPVNTAAWQALEPVRQAIARRDYAAAQQALQQARQTIPNDPALAVYENLIRTGMAQPNAGRSNSVVRTPIPGVTPLPVLQTPVPTPEPTPAATPVAAGDESATSGGTAGGLIDKANNLFKNDTIKYAVYGAAALILLLILWAIFRKKKKPETDQSEAETPVPGSLSAVTGFEGSDYNTGFDPNAGSTDFGSGNPATDFSALNDTGTGGAALGGAAMGAAAAGAVPDFTTFGLDDEDDEKAPAKPAFIPRASKPPEDEGPLSLDDDSPTTILNDVPPSEPIEPTAPSAAPENTGGVSFESLGLEPPATPPKPAPAPAPANPTPTSTPSTPPGEVNLDDIFGNQGFPGEQEQPQAPAGEEDRNSQTLPTFVSTPGTDNPEDNVEIPGKGLRPAAAEEKDQTISFDELFGGASKSMPSVEPRSGEPTAARAPVDDTQQPEAEPSVEDALAATLGAMQAQEPGAPDTPATSAAESTTGETLDERTERMFNDQMEKARRAMAAQDWRQAVHVLSIASALHPEHEEARQMLRDARAEKRKAEESV